MKIRYIYSATAVISTEDCTILCDPWWGTAYDGAWVQWPQWAKSLDEAVEVCGPADFIFVSHVHPDHYDPAFMKAYLAKYPKARVLVADQDPPLLQRKLEARGIKPVVGPVLEAATAILPLPNRGSTFNIDSALIVKRNELSVVNLNDNPYDQAHIDWILRCCDGRPTVALLPFVGAGPWPQCYEMDSDVRLMAALAKKQKYLQLFKRYCEALQPKVAIPFAGQYWLHGDQLNLNQLRGMADATECIPLWKYVWVPADGGKAVLTVGEDVLGQKNPDQWVMNGIRKYPYDWPTVRDAITKLDSPGYLGREAWRQIQPRYEQEIQVPIERLPLLKLLQSAVRNAYPQFRYAKELHICIKTQLSIWFFCATNDHIVAESANHPTISPRVEVHIDARYLYGMLTRLYNANSVRIGSLCRFKVVPAEYNKELDDLWGEYWDSLRV